MVSKRVVVGIVLALIILAGVFVYFAINPSVAKPDIDKPAFEGTIENRHIQWLANELGAYKIHASPANEEAVMEFIVENKSFAVTTKNGVPDVSGQKPANPDLKIIASKESFAEIFAAADLNGKVIELYNSGKVSIEVMKDETTLALKGYLGIYQEISASK